MSVNNIFIEGEKIDLCVPIKEDIPQWASWLNKGEVTKYLDQGFYPNNVDTQYEFYKKSLCDDSKLVLLIRDKSTKLIGCCSLSSIDYKKRTCDIALFIGEKVSDQYMALEAIFRLSEHAFKVLGMNLINAGQCYPDLLNWTQKMQIAGYKPYGIMPRGFIHGEVIKHKLLLSLSVDDYRKIKNENKTYWQSEEKLNAMLNNIKKENSARSLYNYMKNINLI